MTKKNYRRTADASYNIGDLIYTDGHKVSIALTVLCALSLATVAVAHASGGLIPILLLFGFMIGIAGTLTLHEDKNREHVAGWFHALGERMDDLAMSTRC